MAKRLAFATAVDKIINSSYVTDDGKIGSGDVKLGHLWNSGLEDNIYPDWQETKAALRPTDNSAYDVPEDDESSPTDPLGTRQGDAPSSGNGASEDGLLSDTEIIGYETTYDASSQEEAKNLAENGYHQVNRKAWEMARDTRDIDTTVYFFIPEDVQILAQDIPEGKFDYVLQDFEQRHVLSEDALDKMTVWCRVPCHWPDWHNVGYAFKTNLRTLFEALYREAFSEYLQSDGEYYWAGAKTISEWEESCDLEKFMEDETTSCSTVADMLHTPDRYKRSEYDELTHRDDAQTAIDRYFAYDFFDERGNPIDDDYDARLSSKGLQCSLAWGDFQSAAASEAAYLPEPSDEVLRITIGKNSSCTLPDGMIHNIQELNEFGMQVEDNDGDWTLRVTQPQKMQEAFSRQFNLRRHMVRGITGTTWYGTMQIAAYSMSATITRIHNLVSENRFLAAIPYANAYEEVIKQGTINYSLMQAHKLDVEALEAELEGDLRMRVAYGANWMTKIRRAFVLGRWHTLFEPEYYDIVE